MHGQHGCIGQPRQPECDRRLLLDLSIAADNRFARAAQDGLGPQPIGDQRPERIQFSLVLDRSEHEGQRAWPG